MPLVDGPRQHDDLARVARYQRKPSLRGTHAGQCPQRGAKPPDLDPQPRPMRRVSELGSERPRDERTPWYVFGPRFGQRACQREQHRTPGQRDHHACVTHDMTAGVDDERFRRLSASTSSSRRGRSSPRAIRRAAGLSRTREALSTSAVSAGIRASRASRAALARAARAVFVRKRRIAIPATTKSWAALDAGGKGAGSSSASLRSASSRHPINRRRRTSRYRACAAFTRSPCSSSVARAASSAFAGQPRSRETSAISASATTHLARATASFGPKARDARRTSAFARTRSPSCAIAMPRSASAGASSRKATRFSAPRGSPAASARAAAVISEST